MTHEGGVWRWRDDDDGVGTWSGVGKNGRDQPANQKLPTKIGDLRERQFAKRQRHVYGKETAPM